MTVYLHNKRKENVAEYPNRAEAEDQKEKLVGLGMDATNIEITQSDPREDTKESEPKPKKSDGGAEVVEETQQAETHSVETAEQAVTELPDEQPGVDTDPMDWVPSDFVDNIDGQPAINRKGYDVLAHHYNISVETEVLVSPSETDFEYAEVVATATTDSGVTYTAHGGAHVDRGDDSYLLLEMSDTRAAKRATARATGVGMIAVSELKNDL